MPAKAVSAGQEQYWERAKAEADKQGRGGDWAYVMGIFKKMTLNKSEGLSKSDPRTAQGFGAIARWPGQIPNRKGMDARLVLRETNKIFAPNAEAAVAGPVPSIESVIDPLGMTSEQEGEWRAFLIRTAVPGTPDIHVRQAVMSKMLTDKMDPALRRPLWDRVQAFLMYQRDLESLSKAIPGESPTMVLFDPRKSLKLGFLEPESDGLAGLGLDVGTESDFMKAAGHKYLRRWKGRDGRWQYEYEKLATNTLKTYQPGDKVALAHKGQKGHFEIDKVRTKDGKRQLYVKHDETGKEAWVSEIVFAELFRQSHNIRDEARRTVTEIKAKLLGVDLTKGKPTAKPSDLAAKLLRARKQKLTHLFDPEQRFHSLMDHGAKSELMGWYKTELNDVVDQIKPAIAKANADLTEIRTAGDDGARQARKDYSAAINGEYDQLVGPVRGALGALTGKLSVGYREQTPGPGRYGVEASRLEQAAWKAGEALKDMGPQVAGSFGGLFKGYRDPDKWATDTKVKISKYFIVAQGAVAAGTATDAAKREHKAREANPVTDKATGKHVRYLIQGKHATNAQKRRTANDVDSLEKSVERVRQAGFGAATRDLTVFMDYRSREKRGEVDITGHGGVYSAGSYQAQAVRAQEDAPGTGGITVFSEGFRDGLSSDVLTHELGHRFYYRTLTPGERAEWESEIEKRTVVPTEAETTALWKAIRGTATHPKSKTGFDFDSLRAALEGQGDLGQAAWGMVRQSTAPDQEQHGVEKAWVREITDHLAGHPVVNPYVSFYGGTNASEYFAEAFTFYVEGGPRNVPQWTRSVFERLTSAAKMRKSEYGANAVDDEVLGEEYPKALVLMSKGADMRVMVDGEIMELRKAGMPKRAVDPIHTLEKAAYTRRWKGPNGKWRYEYPRKKKEGPPTKTSEADPAPKKESKDPQGPEPLKALETLREVGKDPNPEDVRTAMLTLLAAARKNAKVKPQFKDVVAAFAKLDMPPASQRLVSQASKILSKAEPRGGKYHRRIPKAGGKGYHYIYDEGKYAGREDAHLDGQETRKSRLSKAVLGAIEAAGEKGATIQSLAGLAAKHGKEDIAGAIKGCVDRGELTHKKGMLYRAKAVKEDTKTEKSNLDLVLDPLCKGAGHKYLRRIPSKKPGRKWEYIYAAESKHHQAEVQVGEKLKVTHEGELGHYEAVGKHGNFVTLKHDETGHEVSVTKDHLLQMFRDQHRSAAKRKFGEKKGQREARQAEAEKLKVEAGKVEAWAKEKDTKEAYKLAAKAHKLAADFGVSGADHHRVKQFALDWTAQSPRFSKEDPKALEVMAQDVGIMPKSLRVPERYLKTKAYKKEIARRKDNEWVLRGPSFAWKEDIKAAGGLWDRGLDKWLMPSQEATDWFMTRFRRGIPHGYVPDPANPLDHSKEATRERKKARSAEQSKLMYG